MGILDDIKRMQGEGKSEQEITALLQQRGIGIKDISDSLSQAKIKQAVAGQDSGASQSFQDNGQMEESIITQPAAQTKEIQQQPEPEQPQAQYPEETYAQQQQYAYAPPQEQYAPQNQQYESYSMNADTVSEIAEQVMSEKLSGLRKQFELILDLKNTTETKILSIDERLKRIEKIIDRLQLSVLQKVGEYITNVDDIKKEIIETQKSFKAMVSNKLTVKKSQDLIENQE